MSKKQSNPPPPPKRRAVRNHIKGDNMKPKKMLTMEQWQESVDKWKGILKKLNEREFPRLNASCSFCAAFNSGDVGISGNGCSECPLYKARVCCAGGTLLPDSEVSALPYWTLRKLLDPYRNVSWGNGAARNLAFAEAAVLAVKILDAILDAKPEAPNNTLLGHSVSEWAARAVSSRFAPDFLRKDLDAISFNGLIGSFGVAFPLPHQARILDDLEEDITVKVTLTGELSDSRLFESVVFELEFSDRIVRESGGGIRPFVVAHIMRERLVLHGIALGEFALSNPVWVRRNASGSVLDDAKANARLLKKSAQQAIVEWRKSREHKKHTFTV